MEQSRELYIKVDKDHSYEFAAALDAALTDGWVRAREAEEDARNHGCDDMDFFYYCRDDRRGREPALISINRSDADTLYVANIVPWKNSRLSPRQYNAVLQDFHDNILSRARPAFPIIFRLGKPPALY